MKTLILSVVALMISMQAEAVCAARAAGAMAPKTDYSRLLNDQKTSANPTLKNSQARAADTTKKK